MKNAVTYTSTLPKDLSDALDYYAQRFKIPKNRLIEKALRSYFDKVKKAEYIQSFKRANQDEDMLTLAEEGLEDYLNRKDYPTAVNSTKSRAK